jgi:predicted metal-dependent phosphoesterase TrpH
MKLMVQYVDLHTHTTASDGLHTPTENVHMALKAGLKGIAITDHDTVAGIKEAVDEGKKIGIVVVPGVEISTVAGGQDVHILGYFIDYHNKQLLDRLKRLRDTRDRRNEMMLDRLRELGFNITIEEVTNGIEKSSDETVGRPHIADVMVKRGYVSSMKEAFDLYLGRDGKAYVNPPRIEPLLAVEWIHEAGGKAVMAHPGLYGDDALIEELIRAGTEGAGSQRLDGIEVYHSDHSLEDESRYLGLARKHHLIITAGSDFHGSRAGEVFHGYIGSKKIDMDVIKKLKIT